MILSFAVSTADGHNLNDAFFKLYVAEEHSVQGFPVTRARAGLSTLSKFVFQFGFQFRLQIQNRLIWTVWNQGRLVLGMPRPPVFVCGICLVHGAPATHALVQMKQKAETTVQIQASGDKRKQSIAVLTVGERLDGGVTR